MKRSPDQLADLPGDPAGAEHRAFRGVLTDIQQLAKVSDNLLNW